MSHPNRSKIMNWPEFLREFRASHNLSQKKLADLLQISARNIENWEAGFNIPPPYLRKALNDISKKI
jgi:transcriptional regulator with XRE-family HTH domain